MENFIVSREFELGSHRKTPLRLEEKMLKQLPSMIIAHFEDKDSIIAEVLDGMNTDDVMSYVDYEFLDPQVEENRYGDLTVLTASAEINFDIDRFQKDKEDDLVLADLYY